MMFIFGMFPSVTRDLYRERFKIKHFVREYVRENLGVSMALVT